MNMSTVDATVSAHVTTHGVPVHASLNPSTYLTAPLMAHMQTVAPGLNTTVHAVAQGIHQLVASSAGPRVRVADHYQMPNLAAPMVCGASTLSLLTTLPGVTHAPMASMSTGVTYNPIIPMPIVPTTVSYNPFGTSTPHVKLPKLNMKRFGGDLTKWTMFWASFLSSIHRNPYLSGIDKFNYLISLLESTAAEAIAGLTSTDAKYEEAVSILQQRFGNPQLIINHHMEVLLNVPSVSSHEDTRGLQKLHDTVEAHVRRLEALKVPSQTYGGFLISVLINKLPSELQLIITREITGLTWDLERLMKIFG